MTPVRKVTTPRRTSPARDVDAVADRLHSAAIHLLRRLRVEDEALGISAPRLSALSVLVFAGPMRIGELAHIEQVEPPTMTRLVDGLERDGYVTRSPDPDDARAVAVEATERGRDALLEGRRRWVEAFSALLITLPQRELAQLGRGVAALERALGSAG
ncbi:MAG: MarR family winged helix-turn-helix transcriptional regulator [Actinomycetota bacterium]